MVSSPWSIKRALYTVGAIVLAGTVIIGCSGGGGNNTSSSLPQTTPVSAPAKAKDLKPVKVSRTSIPSVMEKLIRASAFYSPRKGAHLRLIAPGRRPMTSSAGEDLSYYG